ncbi:MAG TPA: PKD domain-containing protein [Methylomirabilota bacterium]|nr:PKD domain-containing protein [Methylomirabilota bacterium]
MIQRPASLFLLCLALVSSGHAADKFFHAAAHNSGVNDTMWLTDAQVFNPDAVNPIEVRLAFLEAGEANLDPQEVAITVGAREAVFLADVVAGTLGRAEAGSIRLASDAPFYASSRTYNIGDGTSGTFGQYIAAAASDDALQQGILLMAANDPDADGYRTNVGFVNPSLAEVEVEVMVYDADSGVLLGSTDVDLPALGFWQINDVFDEVDAEDSVLRNATVEFLATAPVLAYASVVDNTSGDAIFVTPRDDSGSSTTPNNPPTATIDQPADDVTVNPGDTVFFSGTASDPDGDDVTVLWDFGDGMTSTELEPGDHTYTDAGVYTVTLTATDDQGLADPTPATRTVTVTAGNLPPDATIDEPTGDVTIAAGGSVFFSGSTSDPDGDPVTVLWDFGDGSSSTQLAPGNHTYADPGVYTVTLTATDDQGLTDPTPATRTVTVEGANQPPNATISQPSGDVTITAGEAVVFIGTASDPDGDPVTVLWNFGDGSSSTSLNHGNHTYSAVGVYTVTLTATDNQGLSDPTPPTRTITVQGANQPPNATIDQPSGNVAIAAGEAVFFAGSASDPDGDPVTVLWNFGDGITSTSLNPGNHTYSAAGVYTVTLTATDSQGLSDPTPPTRTITVTAAAPTLTLIQSQIFTPACATCHAGGSPSADLNLEAGQSYSNLVNVPATTEPGTRVIPNNPDNSVLVTFLEDGHRSRPQSEIDTIRGWISAGAQNN